MTAIWQNDGTGWRLLAPTGFPYEQTLHDLAQPDTLPGVYERILESGQNAERKARVIGGAIGGVHKLKPVLCGFDPAQVVRKYPTDRRRA